jgi:hypothetical protein
VASTAVFSRSGLLITQRFSKGLLDAEFTTALTILCPNVPEAKPLFATFAFGTLLSWTKQ